jgi:hypothetical protein
MIADTFKQQLDQHLAQQEDCEMQRNSLVAKAIRKSLLDNIEAIEALEESQRSLKYLEDLLA